jgi:hypothetical protein
VNLKPGDPAGVLGGLTLRIVKIGGNGDDRFRHGIAGKIFRHILEVLQKHGGDFRRAVFLAVQDDANVAVFRSGQLIREVGFELLHLRCVMPPAHETFDGIDRIGGVGDHLAFGDLAEQPISLLGEGHNGRSRPAAETVGHNLNRGSFQDRNAGIRGAKINAYDFSHILGCRRILFS